MTVQIDAADLEQMIAATLLCHDALVSTMPARQYDWEAELEPALRFVSDFSDAYDPAAVSEALHQSLSVEDHAAFLTMAGEVDAALHELLVHDKELH